MAKTPAKRGRPQGSNAVRNKAIRCAIRAYAMAGTRDTEIDNEVSALLTDQKADPPITVTPKDVRDQRKHVNAESAVADDKSSAEYRMWLIAEAVDLMLRARVAGNIGEERQCIALLAKLTGAEAPSKVEHSGGITTGGMRLEDMTPEQVAAWQATVPAVPGDSD